jgi:hypothetical protein
VAWSDEQAFAAFYERTVPALPGADVVWVKAQLVRRWEAERRIERPLEAMQSVHIALGLVAAVVLLVWSAPLLRAVF